AAVRDGIADYLGGPMVSNDGEPFPASRHSDELAAWARGRVAALLGAPAGEVLFGPNMTTLTSMFVRAVEAGVRPGDEIVCTELDHEANSAPWRAMAERRRAVVRTARTRDGRLPAEAAAELPTPRTRRVAVPAARSGARLFVPAVQAVPLCRVDAAAWSADAGVVSAYKWYGPRLGALWVSEAAAEEAVLPEQPPSAGTALPGRLETGTLGFEQILGTGIAAEMLLRRDRAADAAREERTAAAIVSALRRIPGVRLVAPPEPGERRVDRTS